MFVELLWIFGSYFAAIILLFAIRWFIQQVGKHQVDAPTNRTRHYVLITQNNESHIEWYLRSIFFFYGWKGKRIRLTFVDLGSDDDTLAIAERLTYGRHVQFVGDRTIPPTNFDLPHLFTQLMDQYPHDEFISVYLNQQQDFGTRLN